MGISGRGRGKLPLRRELCWKCPQDLTDIHVSLDHGLREWFELKGTIKLICFEPLPWAVTPSIRSPPAEVPALGE